MLTDLNPYSVAKPGNCFVGHRQLRREVIAGLLNSRSYAVVGGHRCGKSSLLLQLRDDLTSVPPGSLFPLPRLLDVKQLQPRSETEFFSALYDRLSEGAVARPITPAEGDFFQTSFLPALKRLTPALERKHGPGWVFVILLDELDAAAHTLPSARCFQLLRQLILTEPYGGHFRLVASGVGGLAKLTSEGSDLSNLETLYLEPIEPDSAIELIRRGYRLSGGLEEQVLLLTGRHPYLLQALLQALWEHRSQLDDEALAKAIQKVQGERFGTFRQWLSAFDEGGCSAYQALAKSGGCLSFQSIQQQLRMGPDLNEVMRVLCFHGVVRIAGPTYSLGPIMFRDWFLSNYQIERVALPPTITPRQRSKSVFVVHGRNNRLRASMYEFLRSLSLIPLEWTAIKEKVEGLSPYIGDILEEGFAQSQAVVVLLTGDDEARLCAEFRASHDSRDETELTPQPRPNVLYEAGMAMAKFPNATVLVQVGKIRGMSDLFGRHMIRMDDSLATRRELARALQKAGCEVDITQNTDWHSAGTFGPPER